MIDIIAFNWHQLYNLMDILVVMHSIISVVINNLEVTTRFISSIRQYTNPPYELILIDNASSEEEISSYFKSQSDQYFKFSHQVSLSRAWNKGIELAKGEIITVANNDTVVPPDWAEKLIDTLDKYPTAGMVHPMTFWIIKNLYFEYKCYSAFDTTFSKPFQLDRFKDIVWGEFMVFRRKALKDVQNFDEIFKVAGAEDLDMNFKLYTKDYDIVIDPRVFIHHQGSATRKLFPEQEMDEVDSRNFEIFKNKWPQYTEGWD